ncbi:MAG TPA: DUF4893 domain-containing protein [Allosphingosinicella sp.]|jgi:hypothetical protein
MSRLRIVCSLAAMTAASACQTPPGAPRSVGPAVVVEEAEDWRAIASPVDAAALDALPARWEQALAAGRAAKLSARIAAEGALLQPDSALERAVPTPGTYRCRYVRPGGRRWAASPPGYCYVGVAGGQLSLATELRGLRLGGYLWEQKGGERLIFLGALVGAGARMAAAYGEDPSKERAGRFERIGEFRYRLVLPEPSPGGLTVVDLVAAPRD